MKLGLIGEVLGHSLSPAIHRHLLGAAGIRGTYELIEIPRAETARRIPELLASLDGFNVTIPYKTEVIPYLDGLSEEAARIGAVNTVAVREGRRLGYNTDYTGFFRTVDAIGADPAGKDVVVLGTGGASRAVIQCLYDRGAAHIAVASRHPEAVSAEFRDFAAARGAEIISYEALAETPGGWLLVNCTPCGMYPRTEASPVADETAQAFPKVIDIIYNPIETELLRAAREGGADTANGLRMLAAQGVAAEEIWLGRTFPEDTVEALIKELEGLL